ncbi:MAG: SLC13 family permease [Verrucomicrobiota bacterium]|jgi:di/tricarboxylate transporter|nr:SLC13 family permease [Verrucomicrobiota bacterium]MDP6753592.1 SLC13 family permease [Verrucomicrobiota bacterium]
MTLEIAIVLGLLAAAVGLFATRALPVDLVTIFLLLALVLTGILEPATAFAGFSSEIIIILASIFVINGALLEGRVLDTVTAWLLRVAGGSVHKLQLTTLSVVGGLSGFMNNTAVTSLFIGPTVSIARRLKASPSKLLMPVCFASILGGTCTLIGTSTNVAVSGEIAKQHQAGLAKWVADGGTDLNGDGAVDSADYRQHAEENNLKIYEPLGLFEITPVGLLIMAVGIGYLMLFGQRLLPDYPDESLAEGFNIREYLSEIVVMPGSRLIGQRVFESSLAEMEFRIVKVLRGKRSFVPNVRSSIEEDDVLLVSGGVEELMAVKDASGIEIHAETKLEDEALQTDDVKIAELLITPKSTLIRRTLKEAHFRQRFGLAVLAIYRHGQSLGRKLGAIRLRAGDLLLVQGAEERLQSLEHDTNLVRLEATEAPSADRRRKGFWALGFFAVAVLAGGVGLASLPVCFLSAAALTVATGCITMQKVYEVIDWRVLIVIGGMTAFGAAMSDSGTAKWLAGGIQGAFDSPRMVLAGFILLTMFLTQTMSNAAAALVVLPVAMQTAGTLEVSGQTYAVAVMLAASSSFIAPFEPACILVSGPGKYRFTDYLKAGLGLTLLVGFLVWLLVPAYWGGL